MRFSAKWKLPQTQSYDRADDADDGDSNKNEYDTQFSVLTFQDL
jgi:hypothetical protein